MNILVTGSSGLVGSALVPALQSAGHTVRCLVRGRDQRGAGRFWWDPAAGGFDPAALREMDAAVHLAGEGIATGRWTATKKDQIRRSRVESTALLARAIATASTAPKVFLCASATGYYGNQGDRWLTEASPRGEGFLAEVCEEWERAADPVRQAGVRCLHARFGIVLSARGGALAKMLPPFRMGLGGVLGPGDQFMSWITLDDLVAGLRHLLEHPTVTGPVNMVSPSPVENREFTRILAATLHRPALFPVPRFAARLLFGEMADETLLSSARVKPAVLESLGFSWRNPTLPDALRILLERPSSKG